MNLLYHLLALEKDYSHDRKKKSYFLNLINFVLMVCILLIILVGLSNRSVFGYLISDSTLIYLFLIYLFLNLVFILIKKNFLFLATFLIIAVLIFIFLKINLTLGVDFYIASIICPLIILIGAILVSLKCSIFIYIFISSMLLLIFFLQTNDYVISDSSWKMSSPSLLNTLLMLIFYFLMTMIFCYLIKDFELKLKKIKETHLEKLIKMVPLLSLGKLAVGLTNEIRIELTIISLVLQNAKINKRDIDNLDLASKAVDQIDQLSRLAYCEFFDEIEAEVFDLNLELKYLLSLFKNKSKKEGITIIFQPSKEYQLHADRLKLDLILINLILNAIDSYENIKSDEKNIFIKFIKKPRNLLIKIKDYGRGIEEQDLSLIFNPYFTSKNKSKSLGLGLYVSQSLMLGAYETKIKVESVLNQGSTFTLYIKNKFLLI